MIRNATAADVPAMLAIYAPYVENSTYTFEYTIPSEEAFLARCAATDERKYPVSFCDLIGEDDWLAQGHDYESPEHDEQLALTWDETIQEYIDDLDEDDVLVSVDYHM